MMKVGTKEYTNFSSWFRCRIDGLVACESRVKPQDKNGVTIEPRKMNHPASWLNFGRPSLELSLRAENIVFKEAAKMKAICILEGWW